MATAPSARRGRPVDPDLRARREREILAAAATIFARDGFAGAEVQEIADEAGVGKGTVYRYFPNKRSLFTGALDRLMEDLGDTVEEAADHASTPMDRVRLGVHAYLGFFDEHPEAVELLILERAVFKDRRRPTYFRHRDRRIGPWRDLFRERIDEGECRDVPVDRITDVINDALYGTIFTNHFAGRTRTFEEQAEDLLDVLLHGILAPAPRRRGGSR